MGWTITQWSALPDDEKVDWLAYEIYRQKQVGVLQRFFKDKIENETPIDIAAYVDTLLAGI